MKIDRYLPHLVSLSLLALSGVYKSPAFAFASVASVLGLLATNLVEVRLAALAIKAPVADEALKRAQDEMKRVLQDVNTRVTTIEYGISKRGF